MHSGTPKPATERKPVMDTRWMNYVRWEIVPLILDIPFSGVRIR